MGSISLTLLPVVPLYRSCPLPTPYLSLPLSVSSLLPESDTQWFLERQSIFCTHASGREMGPEDVWPIHGHLGLERELTHELETLGWSLCFSTMMPLICSPFLPHLLPDPRDKPLIHVASIVHLPYVRVWDAQMSKLKTTEVLLQAAHRLPCDYTMVGPTCEELSSA